MAILEFTFFNEKTGRINLQESFELDEDTARLFLARLEKMLADFEKPLRVVKTLTHGGITTLDIYPTPPPIRQPTFEERYRRALPPPRQEV